MKWISCSLLLALGPTVQAGAADRQYDVIPAPLWAEVVAPPSHEQNGAQARGGTEYQLTDVQERLDGLASRYHHYVSRVLNTAGVDQNAQITVNFDPKLEKPHLHAVKVQREGAIMMSSRSAGSAITATIGTV